MIKYVIKNKRLFDCFGGSDAQHLTHDPPVTGKVGIDAGMCFHTFHATRLTNFLANGGTLENAQAMEAHESPCTTKLYDRTGNEITLDEVERIAI